MALCEEIASVLRASVETEYSCSQLDDGVIRLVTPWVNHWGDNLELEVEVVENGYLVSDRHETVDRLWLQGVEVEDSKEKALRAEELAESLGVQYKNAELLATCDKHDLAVTISAVAQAALRVEGIINAVQPVVRRNFPEEVAGSFAVQKLPFDRNIYYQGAVKRSRVNFVFRNGHDTLVNALSATTKKNAETLAELNAFRFDDIREIHVDVMPLVVYDLRDDVWTSGILNIMNAHDILTFGYPEQKADLVSAIKVA